MKREAIRVCSLGFRRCGGGGSGAIYDDLANRRVGESVSSSLAGCGGEGCDARFLRMFLGAVQKAVYTELGTSSSFCEIDANYDELWKRVGTAATWMGWIYFFSVRGSTLPQLHSRLNLKPIVFFPNS